MAIVIRRRGDDIPILIGLTDSSNVAMNIDDLAELYVYIIHSTEETILAKFSKAGTDDFLPLIQISSTSYRADILSSVTKVAPLGEYHLDINVVETDADYEESEKNTIGLNNVFTLKDSISKAKSSG